MVTSFSYCYLLTYLGCMVVPSEFLSLCSCLMVYILFWFRLPIASILIDEDPSLYIP